MTIAEDMKTEVIEALADATGINHKAVLRTFNRLGLDENMIGSPPTLARLLLGLFPLSTEAGPVEVVDQYGELRLVRLVAERTAADGGLIEAPLLPDRSPAARVIQGAPTLLGGLVTSIALYGFADNAPMWPEAVSVGICESGPVAAIRFQIIDPDAPMSEPARCRMVAQYRPLNPTPRDDGPVAPFYTGTLIHRAIFDVLRFAVAGKTEPPELVMDGVFEPFGARSPSALQ